jgi:HlyD family secretion protein
MDREISKEVRRKELRKQLFQAGTGIAAIVVVVCLLVSLFQIRLNRKNLIISTVDRGLIEVSVNASGKVAPAFEEIINSPIHSRIVEVYRKGGECVALYDFLTKQSLDVE